MNNQDNLFVLIIFSLFLTNVFGQNEVANTPVIIEAESGEVGYEFDVLDETISILTNFDETTGSASYPGEDRTVLYEVMFPDMGTYDLFARVRVGSSGFDDDSFFYSNDFGEKNPADDGEWILCNGLASAGFTGADDVVRDPGGVGSNTWKWVNLSRNAYQAANRDFNIYSDVPREIFDDLMNAPSKGSFLNREIKSIYQFSKQ